MAPETALHARIDAIKALLDEREERTKERFLAMDKGVSAALVAADKAVSKAEIATEKRFEGVNEFRETLRDQAATLMPRSEYFVQHQALIDRVGLLEKRSTESMGLTRGFGIIGSALVGLASAAAALVVAYLGWRH